LFWSYALLGASADATMQVNSDGTASITGKVEENYKGCARDGVCYFRLTFGKSEIRVVYDPGETDALLPNSSHVPQLMKVERGAIIEVYGSHRERGLLHTIDAYSRKEYFIHIVPK
jgi:hypothetical protein